MKNNLAVVSAILGLQARASPSAVREQLESARDRVAAIADLHATLYRQNSTVEVNLCTHVAELADRLSQALCDDERIRVQSQCDKSSLPCTTPSASV